MADLSITAADVRIVRADDEHQFTGPAEEAITAGQACRLNASTGKFTKANASAATECNDVYIAAKTVAVNEALTAYKNPCIIDLGDAITSMDYGADVYLSDTDGGLADADPSANEQVTATITGSPTGGTFTLTFGAQTTAAIAYNATAAVVEAALEALSTIGQGNVQVTGADGGPYTIEFVGDLKRTNVGAVTADGSSLTGGTDPDVTIAVAQAGVHQVIVGKVTPGWGYTTADKLLRLTVS